MRNNEFVYVAYNRVSIANVCRHGVCIHFAVCSPPRATIGLEFVEYTWRENEYHSLQVCTVATDVAFQIVAEFHIKNGTASGISSKILEN